MPVLTFLAVVCLALVALFFVADATLENVSPIVTSQQSGLPKPRQPDAIQTLTTAPAPEPDMKSQAVLATQPAPEALTKTRAEASPNRVWQPFRHKQQNQFDRFSIKSY
jgi:hypothetical protein